MATAHPELNTTLDDAISQDEFEKVWQVPDGIWGQLTTVQNSVIGIRFIVTAFIFFALAGLMALLMRLQLIQPENTFLGAEAYNQLFTMHGSTMMYLFVIPLLEGIFTLVLPQMLGSRELPFPRLTAFAYWTFLFGGIIFYASFLFDAVPASGWFAYTPLSGPEFSPGIGMDFWLLGLNVAEIAAIAGAFEIIIAFFVTRAPGMTLDRIPIFAWALLVTAFMMLFAFTPLIVGSLLLEFDRKFGTLFYNAAAGGDPLLWQHLFWIFGHPDVYIQFIPPIGMVSTIIPVFARRKLVGYPLVVMALLTTGILSFGLWVHHMFTTGLPEISISFFSAVSILVAIPSGIQIFVWLATMWRGKLELKSPLLFIMGFFMTFVLGGITGVMSAVAPLDWQIHDSYFIVAHLHYVLFGGMLFPIFAGIYYWSPKFLMKTLDENLGKWHFWLVFIGFNVTFFPMHMSGILGMPRRVYTYQVGSGLWLWNALSTIGVFFIAAGILVFFCNVFISWRKDEIPDSNPWGADTLEWGTPTPTPQYGYREFPIVKSRHPLWDQDDLFTGDELAERINNAMKNHPYRYRAQITVSPLEAKPQEMFRVAGPSIFPFALALAMTLFSFFLIFDMVIPALVMAVGSGIALIGWHWQPTHLSDMRSHIEDALEERMGIPVHMAGSRSIIRGGLLLTMLTVGIALATLIFCYFYIRLNFGDFPPNEITLPSAWLPVVGLLLLLLSGLPIYIARQSTSENNRSRLRLGLIGAIILTLLSLGIQWYGYADLGFDHTTNAYASAFIVLVVFQILMVAIATIALAVLLFWIIQGHTQSDDTYTLTNMSMIWAYIITTQILIFGVLHIVPQLI